MDNPIEDLAARLAGRNLSEVARRAGVAYQTVWRLSRGERADIYIETWRKISEALDAMDHGVGA